jgi:hypothetical protein
MIWAGLFAHAATSTGNKPADNIAVDVSTIVTTAGISSITYWAVIQTCAAVAAAFELLYKSIHIRGQDFS